MRMLQPVVWAKGTFLTPQHLQLQDRYLESLLEFRLEALQFRPWGFHELQIDRDALATGNFAITSASGILPDGLLFEIPESDPAPAPKSLAPYFGPDQEKLDVYLTLPPHRESGVNVANGQMSADARYSSDVMLVRDENTGRSEKPVQIARKNLRFMVESEIRETHALLPVARILRTPAGLMQLDPTYVPPLLSIAASDYLMSMLRRLVEILTSRSSVLSGMRRQKNQSLADFTSSDIANFWLLYTVNTHLPLFRHLFESRAHHPEEMFSLMTSLAGALTTFSTRLQPRDLPLYDHGALSPCFTDLDEKLRMLLETVIPSNFVSLPLTLIQPNIYGTPLEEDKYFTATKMYLAVSAEVSEGDLITKAPHLVKVCSSTQIEHLIRHALPGVTLIHSPQPPSSVPIKLNYQYFSLNQGGGAWEAIVRARNFAAYVPGDFPNPQLELLILLPPGR